MPLALAIPNAYPHLSHFNNPAKMFTNPDLLSLFRVPRRRCASSQSYSEISGSCIFLFKMTLSGTIKNALCLFGINKHSDMILNTEVVFYLTVGKTGFDCRYFIICYSITKINILKVIKALDFRYIIINCRE